MADEGRRPEVVTADAESTWPGRVCEPAVDIYEREGALLVVADVPGADRQGVDIHVEDGVLTIGARAATERPGGYSLSYSEYEPGHYRREFSLGDAVDVEKIEASMKDGVLRIVLPKSEAARPKKIEVQTG